MAEVNDAIAGDNPQCMFVTLFIGILDWKQAMWCSATEAPPIRVSTSRQCEYVNGKSGPAVGVMEEVPFKELSVDLQPGEALFLCTDGVTEARKRSSAPKKHCWKRCP